MMLNKKEKIVQSRNNKLTTFEEHLDKHRCEKGTVSRAKYEADSLAFRLGVMLQEAELGLGKTLNVSFG